MPNFPEANKCFSGNNNKFFVLRIMPMLPFSYPWFYNINRNLSPVSSFDEFGKTTAVIYVYIACLVTKKTLLLVDSLGMCCRASSQMHETYLP